ncbi:LADA_0E10374g1_1 [Lachancea dasiensis]|uniref:Conserved oligomeric Golgi complex subunit 5 n=1 Tax=Lachancea dasiensis TaxID=1072105 RepID=A0A1G4JDZ3_9SACH|nr:LADA_0E10374g1_1 [Lachancea dasiensis]
MTNKKYLKDFEEYLADDFNAVRACSELIKASNVDPESSELDLVTSIKKVGYNIDEVDKRIESVIKANSLNLVDVFDNRKLAQEKSRESLSSSVEYLSMSYSRLEKDVLKPYEQCTQLQAALSKIHQTSSLLRDVLIFMHLVRQIAQNTISASEKEIPDQNLLILASIHSQIQMELSSNPSMRALRLVKKHELETVGPSRRETLRVLTETLLRYCGESSNPQEQHDTGRLLSALYKLSQKDFISTIDKVVQLRVNSSCQTLSKTITSIRNFPHALQEAIVQAHQLANVEDTLRMTPAENTNLLQEHSSHKKYASLTHIFWNRVAKSFKRDFEISYHRGGPVGKSLASNSKMIIDSIEEMIARESAKGRAELEQMRDSVSIIRVQTTK